MIWGLPRNPFAPDGPEPGTGGMAWSTLDADIGRWAEGEAADRRRAGQSGTQCLIFQDLPATLAHVHVTKEELLRFVGKDKPVSTLQSEIFEALVADAGVALWFHEISRSGLRISHFLAQCHHESGGFTSVTESFHYSNVDGLRDAFGDRLTAEERKTFLSRKQKDRHEDIETAFVAKYGKPTTAKLQADLLKLKQDSDRDQADLQVRLANKVYNGRMGNVVGSNDGYTYRGRGIIQLTGRNNYESAGKELGLPLLSVPERAAEPAIAVRTAVWYWQRNCLNDYADLDDCLKVGQAINLGPSDVGSKKQPNKQADRLTLTTEAKAIWGGKAPS